MKTNNLFLMVFCAICMNTFAHTADSVQYIKVHFLYGSRPAKKFRNEERKWFGGILGGHVGVEIDSGKILNFVPSGGFHIFSHNRTPVNRRSCFTWHNEPMFYSILGGPSDSMKKLIVTIPVTSAQKKILDSLQNAYRANTPYDYAFFGYRCGAAAYDVISRAGVMKKFGFRRTYMKIFYPRRLRKRLIKMAKKHGWNMALTQGTNRRVWEGDR